MSGKAEENAKKWAGERERKMSEKIDNERKINESMLSRRKIYMKITVIEESMNLSLIHI